METSLEQLSTSGLRALLIEETKVFVQQIDKGDEQVLKDQRSRLLVISAVLAEKEKKESAPIVWGKSSSKIATEPDSPVLD